MTPVQGSSAAQVLVGQRYRLVRRLDGDAFVQTWRVGQEAAGGKCGVPVFHDYHPPGELPRSVFRANLCDLDARRPEPAGVHLLDYVLGVGGSMTCVLAAHNEEAVRQYHAEQGVPCGRVERGWPTLQGPAPMT